MKKKLAILVTFLCIISCKKITDRPPLKGIVIDSATNKGIENVIVRYVENYEIIEETNTDHSGMFIFSKKEITSLISLEGRSKEFTIEFIKKDFQNYILSKQRH